MNVLVYEISGFHCSAIVCNVLLIKSVALGISIADRGYLFPCTISVSVLGQLQSQKVKLNVIATC